MFNSQDAIGSVRQLLNTLSRRQHGPILRSLPVGLTSSEAKVLQFVAQGKSNHQIAQELQISEKTMANHLSHIFYKTGSNNWAASLTPHSPERSLVFDRVGAIAVYRSGTRFCKLLLHPPYRRKQAFFRDQIALLGNFLYPYPSPSGRLVSPKSLLPAHGHSSSPHRELSPVTGDSIPSRTQAKMRNFSDVQAGAFGYTLSASIQQGAHHFFS